jgi:hypothetical protein
MFALTRTKTYGGDIPDVPPPVVGARAARTYKFPQINRREGRHY